ncbi:MinD/ParA family ATP-binding protein [Mycobacterium sp. IDR2000157661]|uniref:MinD/ParA family ATP-binding protein n=1 Tax=Mycobacterium sp. IDR2000157661 TaxID=2867005 RepID=UPI001EEE39E8|nr:MinD/ParA family protein [Mycobacterium sp. IDR2000157661]ULE34769.1 MinD/ParA family protein [Mycobacterium sp. IDR2000157661]
MTDRDDALRRDLGWTGPEETDFEPDSHSPEPMPPGAAPDATVAREADPPRGSFHPGPPRYGPPPGVPRDTGPLPTGTWGAQPTRQPPRPPRESGPPPHPQHLSHQPPPMPPPQSGQWTGGGFTPEVRPTPPPSGSYAERIRADELVPTRKRPPSRGWRRALFRASFGLVNLGPGPDEIRQAELETKIKSVLRGHYKVGVMGKGGVGKTTVSASIGSVFAELRQDDRVVAIDADTAFGKLGSRVDPRAQGSYWELASDQHLDTFADIRSRVGNNAAGLFVLAGEATPARRRILDPAIYREATSRLDRYFTISVIDCSSTMDSPVTQEVLRDLDALVVVSSPWVDGAAVAGQTLDWLAARGLTSLLQRTVIVLNDSDGHADKRTRSILAQQFSSQGQRVIEVPYDGHLRPGGVIDGTSEMAPATRRRFLEIAAALADQFPTRDDRSRERH